MDPSSGQTQQMSSQSSLENMLGCSKAQQDRKPRPQPEQAQKCPRCDSTNTKFCYYNNYSLSQPRYFCKSCRRYWTKGGTLRNVPVGGGCRKNKRSSSSSSSSKRVQDQDQDQTFSPILNPFNSLPHSSYDHSSTDFMALALARLQKQACGQLGYDHDHDLSILGNPSATTNTSSFCDILGNLGMNNHGFLGSGTQYNNNVQNMYGVYNGNGGDTGEVTSGNNSIQMMLPYDQEMSNAAVATTAMRQELCSGREQSESKVLGGFTWQLNGGTELDSGRASWNNGFTTTSWHGLLHSPLM